MSIGIKTGVFLTQFLLALSLYQYHPQNGYSMFGNMTQCLCQRIEDISFNFKRLVLLTVLTLGEKESKLYNPNL